MPACRTGAASWSTTVPRLRTAERAQLIKLAQYILNNFLSLFVRSYAINTLTRLFTLPMRRSLPSFYILGFPKCGTTTLAEHLKQHPAISGVDGLPYHEALRKESHFFSGILGRSNAHSAAAYRSFFPTVMRRWWAEAVCGVDKVRGTCSGSCREQCKCLLGGTWNFGCNRLATKLKCLRTAIFDW